MDASTAFPTAFPAPPKIWPGKRLGKRCQRTSGNAGNARKTRWKRLGITRETLERVGVSRVQGLVLLSGNGSRKTTVSGGTTTTSRRSHDRRAVAGTAADDRRSDLPPPERKARA